MRCGLANVAILSTWPAHVSPSTNIFEKMAARNHKESSHLFVFEISHLFEFGIFDDLNVFL